MIDIKKIVWSGYAYLLTDSKDWKKSSNENWDTVMRSALEGRIIGERTIDGSEVVVFEVGGEIYAILKVSVA